MHFLPSYLWLTLIFGFRSLHAELSSTFNDQMIPENESLTEIPRPFPSIERESRRLAANEDIFGRHSLRPSLMDIALQRSAHQGLEAMNELYTKIEPDIIKKGHFLDDNHPAALLAKFSAPTLDGSKPNAERAAYAVLSATKAFRKNYKYINDLARHANAPKISLRHTALEGLCPPRDPPTCMPASHRYRTHDGTCNNRRRPRWGAAQMPFNRFIQPVYGDGVDSIREGESGPLSSSRFVSLLVHGARDGEAPLTIMIAQWGQLLDHDMTSTAQPRSINGSIPSCCGSNDFHPSCFPIKVPQDDPWLGPLKVRCLEFLRSAAAQRRDCMLSWREQTNQATSYIDASPIYSNHVKSSDVARVFRHGLLVYGRGNPNEDVCLRGAIASQCIRAGDGRSGEQPGLLALHHVWVGEHNRIALELGELNQHWSDEKIYQETRRIVGAMFQHITYREFLPLILGKEVCRLFELELLPLGYYDGYDPKVNPTIANSFAAAAFRFGHSLIQNSYMRCDRHHNVISNNVSLHEEFQRGDIGSAGSLHRLIRGMAAQRALRRDEFITPELTNHLFQTPGFPFGLDLAAINIQRGRDHGIPPYTSWRTPCGLSVVNDWDDFANIVGPESAQRIRQAYRSVHDIDLFVGGIAERPVVGGLVGPTFACIIAQQFSNSRKGDRFWYENGNLENSFTPAQLHALRRVSLAQVLCRTVGGGTFQPHIFIPPGFNDNQRLPCGKGPLAPIDLSAWQEQDPFLTQTSDPTRTPQQNVQSPDRIFDIISTDTSSTPLTTVHIIKEEKVGFLNRGKPIEDMASVTSVGIPSKTSSGLHKSKNITKINDKLDFKRKSTTKSQPVRTHSIIGINNKLDQNKRITLSLNEVSRRRNNTPKRRKVIVNNVAIELRNVENTTVTNQKYHDMDRKSTKSTTSTPTAITPKHKKRKSPSKTNKNHIPRLELTKEDEQQGPVTTDMFIFQDDETDDLENLAKIGEHDTVKTPFETTTNEFVEHTDKKISKSTENITDLDYIDNDIDPLQRTEPLHDNVRVQRQLDETKGITTRTGSTTNAFRNKASDYVLNVKEQSKSTTHIRLGTTTNRTIPKIFLLNSKPLNAAFTSTLRPQTKRTTPVNMELRQYQTRQSYTRPHKVIYKGPHSDQYEIEINIKQTSATVPKEPIRSNNGDYFGTSTNVYKPYGLITEKYSPDHINYGSTTPAYPYYKPPVTVPTPPNTHKKRTKPPTVIYLNEYDRDNRLTTKPPSVFQSFLNFANNGLRPQTPISSISTDRKEHPMHYSPSSPHSSNQDSNQYGLSAQPPFPAAMAGLSQIGGIQSSTQDAHQYGLVAQSPFPSTVGSQSQTGGLHASSSAISTGNFGTIMGVASANGGDSIFSFNIRPNPEVGTDFSPASPEYTSHHFTTVPLNSYYKPQYLEQSNSPFSSDKRPLMQEYFKRPPANNGVFNENQDYDYSSRMLAPLSNLTSVLNNDDALYNDDYESNEETTLVKKYDRDGYLRPSFMMKNITKTNNNRTVNIKDEYILPLLNLTRTNPFESPKPMTPFANLLLNMSSALTSFNDSNSKNLNNDISAENDFTDETPKLLIKSKTIVGNPTKTIAFAPIKILTNLERPDNWIFYETPKNKPLLPDPPEILAESSQISEIPKPFNDQKSNPLGQEHREITIKSDGN